MCLLTTVSVVQSSVEHLMISMVVELLISFPPKFPSSQPHGPFSTRLLVPGKVSPRYQSRQGTDGQARARIMTEMEDDPMSSYEHQ